MLTSELVHKDTPALQISDLQSSVSLRLFYRFCLAWGSVLQNFLRWKGIKQIRDVSPSVIVVKPTFPSPWWPSGSDLRGRAAPSAASCCSQVGGPSARRRLVETPRLGRPRPPARRFQPGVTERPDARKTRVYRQPPSHDSSVTICAFLFFSSPSFLDFFLLFARFPHLGFALLNNCHVFLLLLTHFLWCSAAGMKTCRTNGDTA